MRYKLFISYTDGTSKIYEFTSRQEAEIFVHREGDHVRDYAIVGGRPYG